MQKTVSIIGSGPAAMALAIFLDPKKYTVSIYEKNKTLGRKFLVAGDGGFNLTHSDPIEKIIDAYTPNNFLNDALHFFSNLDLCNWLLQIGIPTFVGTSKRIFPQKGIKPIEVLNAILLKIKEKQVQLFYNHEWLEWNSNNELVFKNQKNIQSSIVVFALGGGSWSITGANKNWLDIFAQKKINTIPFQASNCAYMINWETNFIQKHEGKPLKNISIKCNGYMQKGEIISRKNWIEGNAMYSLSPQIRFLLNTNKTAELFIDLKPNFSIEKIIEKLSAPKNISQQLRENLNLNPTQIDLIKNYTSKNDFQNISLLADRIKNIPIQIVGTAEIDQAISTVGGIDLNELDKNFQLKKMPKHYCIGEMLDYDAPTGGYLLQSCFSMGAFLAKQLNDKIEC
ncbi:MAG: NAD(P)-dependent oxidoreductase [Chitinophagaceae bacterium]|nr:NAD(P)-dependent oxidoreductase [Chitinophagaceae bacterium]